MLTMTAQGVLLSAVMWCLMRIMNENKSETFRRRVVGRMLRLNRSEFELLDSVCDSKEIDEDFSIVGGLARVKDAIQRSVVLPFKHPELYPPNSLRGPPKGVLLYGPPGTGKTLLAKAIAKCCGAAFVEVKVESLFGKWLGQSEQAVAAIFSLARKLSPCIIFVDELDSLLSHRDFNDNHAYTNAKTIFLRQWDGFNTREKDHQIVVIGATNCPQVLDSAVLRRLPVKLRLDLPSKQEREDILRILLRDEDVSDVDLGVIADHTPRYSGSDLRELCKQALLLVVQEQVRQLQGNNASAGSLVSSAQARTTLHTSHLLIARSIVGANRDFAAGLAAGSAAAAEAAAADSAADEAVAAARKRDASAEVDAEDWQDPEES